MVAPVNVSPSNEEPSLNDYIAKANLQPNQSPKIIKLGDYEQTSNSDSHMCVAIDLLQKAILNPNNLCLAR